MASVTVLPSTDPVVGELLVLEDGAGRVELSPTRGALVTSFRVGGRELLYLDESTLHDATKSVRGGVPVLFPSPGKLVDDSVELRGKRFTMKQHGFARNLPWSVGGSSTDGAASVTLALESKQATLSQYPWAFRATLSFALSAATLRITSRVWNDDTAEMPYGVGYHPYFAVADKAGARIDTRATKAFDNVTKTTGPFTAFDLTAPEVDVHLIDHGGTASALHLSDGARIDVRGSAEFTRWVVWTVTGKPFVCLEPWTCPGNALNTGESLIRVAPGASHESWIEVGLAG
jgi:galactose mutarotase-like enzyme